MWITSPPLEVEEAKLALQKAIPNLDEYIKQGQIEIISYDNWYLLDGKFDTNMILEGWVRKEKAALAHGFEGLRLTGNTFWVERELWNSFVDYEEAINKVIGQHRMLALCTYCLKNCVGTDVLDVVRNHVGTLIKQGEKWSLIEDSVRRKKADAEIAKLASFPAMNPNPIIEVDTNGNLKYANASALTTFPNIQKHPLQHPFFSSWEEILKSVKAEKKGAFSREHKIGDRWYHQQFYLVPHSQSIRSYTIQIDQVKQAEKMLRESEERWATTVSSIGDAVIATDVKGNITFLNSVAEKITGWELQDAQQKPLKQVFNIINAFTREEIESPVDRVIREGLVVGLANHTILVRKDGTEVPIDDSGAPIKDKRGNITGVVLVFRDITERKKAEEALQRAKVDWERTFNSVPDLIAILDDKHKIVRANKALAKALGTTPEKCIGLPCYKCMHGTDKPPIFCPHSESLSDEQEHTVEVHEERLGGDFIVSTTPLKDEHGRMIGSVHVARDITERKKSEDSLKKSEERYRSYIEVTGELGWTTNAQGEVVEDIPAFRKFTGQSFEEVKGWGWSKALHPEDFEKTIRIWKNAVATKSQYDVEYRLRRSDGVYRHFLARGVPVFTEDGSVREWVGTCIDITSRKEMENELLDTLKASQDRQSEVSALLEASKAVLVRHEFSDAARAIFDSCKGLLGAKAGYVALMSNDEKENNVLFLDSGGLVCLVDPSLEMPIRGLRAKAYDTGKTVYDNEFPNSKWAKLLPKGHVQLKNVLFAPLTIDNKTVGIIGLANKEGSFTEHDAQMATAFGEIASIALINSRILEKLEANEKLLKSHSEHLEKMVEEKTKQLRDSERLAAIGATAGMVGHDIRNPLQAITCDLYLARTELDSCPDSTCKASMKESLLGIEKNIEYINKIVADLQDFAKPLKPNVSQTNLEQIINEVLYNHSIPENIQVQSNVQKDAHTIMSDASYVKRILSNLVNNALQAMPSGGRLSVEAYTERSDVIVTVADTGVGIPEDVKEKLFTPLFTTKSKGQGFGLAVVKRMAEALGGAVTFESQAGKGTKFIVRLTKRKNRSHSTA
jgi:PAS domain S-box-containing protein